MNILSRVGPRALLFAVLAIGLVTVWAGVFYENRRAYSDATMLAQEKVDANAREFADYTYSAIKRADMMLLNLRHVWETRPQDFKAEMDRQRNNITDISVQATVADRNGMAILSNIVDASRAPGPALV